MDSAKQQLIEKLKNANNVLVTVSRNPSVDQLAALLGLGLILNKQGKHAAAVFSGQVPSTIEFLKPEDTFEKNTDSLRDFIIALDKSKADKLRYKVEDNIVRIFITPYKTSITQADLDFSQGDFNVDLVIALGVKRQADLDDAITAHGRILHDATVASVNIDGGGELGSINWRDQGASSLSELVTELSQALGDSVLDQQIATALLTGVVSETNRFSNDKTSSQTMTMSAVLMAAGANQQLVATKLEEPNVARDEVRNDSNDHEDSDDKEDEEEPQSVVSSDGTLEINHENGEPRQPDEHEQEDNQTDNTVTELPAPEEQAHEEPAPAPLPEPNYQPPEVNQQPITGLGSTSKLVTEPPMLGGTLTANTRQDVLDPSTDPFSMPKEEAPQLLDRPINNINPVQPMAPPIQPAPGTDFQPQPQPGPSAFDPISNPPASPLFPPSDSYQPAPMDSSPVQPDSPWANLTAPTDPVSTPIDQSGPQNIHVDDNGTLSQLEEAVNSPHLNQDSVANADQAREEINQALNASTSPTQPPIEALNSQPLGPELHQDDNPQVFNPTVTDNPSTTDSSAPAPPPVPPPIPFEFGNPPS
jgi:hypothetical protein